MCNDNFDKTSVAISLILICFMIYIYFCMINPVYVHASQKSKFLSGLTTSHPLFSLSLSEI